MHNAMRCNAAHSSSKARGTGERKFRNPFLLLKTPCPEQPFGPHRASGASVMMYPSRSAELILPEVDSLSRALLICVLLVVSTSLAVFLSPSTSQLCAGVPRRVYARFYFRRIGRSAPVRLARLGGGGGGRVPAAKLFFPPTLCHDAVLLKSG